MSLVVMSLSSNASLKLYPNNSPEKFTVQLPDNGLDLDDGGGKYEWYAALASITFPKTWNTLNFDSSCNEFEITLWRRDDDLLVDPVVHKFSFAQLAHKTLEKLIASTNASLNEMKNEIGAVLKLHVRKDGRLLWQLIVSNESFFTLYKEMHFTMHRNVWKMLGFSDNSNFIAIKIPDPERVAAETTTFPVEVRLDDKGDHRPDINAGQYSICVFTDIINSSFVGDSKACLLAVLSASGQFGKYITVEPERLDFIKLRTTRFQRVSFSIESVSGIPVQFESGQITLTLHLNRILKDG